LNGLSCQQFSDKPPDFIKRIPAQMRLFFETNETETRASALPPARVLASEPDAVSRRLIFAHCLSVNQA
jgi:hypothetical protein